ncbi:MAG: electron transfer flavoprotein subunit beta/FixA family protein [Candidatus Bathyarchaeia archaeon]
MKLRIVVLVKDIPDLTEIKIDQDRRPILTSVKRRINDLDKRALESAVRLKEKYGGEVITLSLGDDKTRTTILEALSSGADSAYIINDKELLGLDALTSAKVLASALKKLEPFDLILCGEMSLDTLSSQIGPRLAETLNLPLIMYAKRIELVDGKLRAERALEDYDEIVEVEPPAIISVIREINEPRIPSLMNIMKAKQKPIIEWNSKIIEIPVDELKKLSSIEILDIKIPLVERKRIMIKGESHEELAEKLVDALISEGVLRDLQ